MKHILSILVLLFVIGCTPVKENQEPTFGIVIHGGAGTILKENMSPEMEQAYRGKLAEAVATGHAILKAGGTSQDAVEQTIHVMENSPLFNSGKGAVLSADESIALDASFMNGKTLDAVAIAGVKHIKNPISTAIMVMNNSIHVMLAGAGADQFAVEQGLDTVPESYFITERRLDALKRVQEKEVSQKLSLNALEEQYLKKNTLELWAV